MYQWDKSIKSMDVPAEEVVHLYRSMRDVQLALPGLPAQEATAYLCQHKASQGVSTIAVFHLHRSNQLAFYVDTPLVITAGKADAVLDQTLMFVESMGFLMNDLDIQLLSQADRDLLWSSLPLQKGVPETEAAPASKPAAVQMTPASQFKVISAPAPAAVEKPAPRPLPPEEKKSVEVAAGTGKKVDVVAGSGKDEPANVDDLLAAVEELRTRRPGVRSRKRPPSPEELKRRRAELCANIGRIWGSL